MRSDLQACVGQQAWPGQRLGLRLCHWKQSGDTRSGASTEPSSALPFLLPSRGHSVHPRGGVWHEVRSKPYQVPALFWVLHREQRTCTLPQDTSFNQIEAWGAERKLFKGPARAPPSGPSVAQDWGKHSWVAKSRGREGSAVSSRGSSNSFLWASVYPTIEGMPRSGLFQPTLFSRFLGLALSSGAGFHRSTGCLRSHLHAFLLYGDWHEVLFHSGFPES